MSALPREVPRENRSDDPREPCSPSSTTVATRLLLDTRGSILADDDGLLVSRQVKLLTSDLQLGSVFSKFERGSFERHRVDTMGVRILERLVVDGDPDSVPVGAGNGQRTRRRTPGKLYHQRCGGQAQPSG